MCGVVTGLHPVPVPDSVRMSAPDNVVDWKLYAAYSVMSLYIEHVNPLCVRRWPCSVWEQVPARSSSTWPPPSRHCSSAPGPPAPHRTSTQPWRRPTHTTASSSSKSGNSYYSELGWSRSFTCRTSCWERKGGGGVGWRGQLWVWITLLLPAHVPGKVSMPHHAIRLGFRYTFTVLRGCRLAACLFDLNIC